MQGNGNILSENSLDIDIIHPVLTGLVQAKHTGEKLAQLPDCDEQMLGKWLVGHELAPFAHAHVAGGSPAFRQLLQYDSFVVVGQNSMHLDNVKKLAVALVDAGISPIFLKGMSVAVVGYGNLLHRPMSDIDLWIPAAQMQKAMAVLGQNGFQRRQEKEDRPLALQELADGEVQFYRADWGKALVELHWSPYAGWWLHRTAHIDTQAIYDRTVALQIDGISARQLTAEDNFIHVATHMVVNHAFAQGAIRSLLDLALLASETNLDWQVVVDNAEKWRLQHVLWLALDVGLHVVTIKGADKARATLQPSAWRRWALRRMITPQEVLGDYKASSTVKRYLLLLLLIARGQDMLTLVFRAIVPDKQWLNARYGKPVRAWHHWWQLLRHRQI